MTVPTPGFQSLRKPVRARAFCRTSDSVGERTESVLAEELVLIQHEALRVDPGVRRCEPVVPDERHALDEGP